MVCDARAHRKTGTIRATHYMARGMNDAGESVVAGGDAGLRQMLVEHAARAIGAAAAARGDTERRRQVGQRARTEVGGGTDLVVGDGVAKTNVHGGERKGNRSPECTQLSS